jgi:hypothetical protein
MWRRAKFLVKTPPQNRRIAKNVGVRSTKNFVNSNKKSNSPPKKRSIRDAKVRILLKWGVLKNHDGVMPKNKTDTPQKC